LDRQQDFLALRAKHPRFIYHGWDHTLTEDSLEITYHFSIPGLAQFDPKWTIQRRRPAPELPAALLEELIFSLGMVELVSYWKTVCPPTVLIEPRTLTPEQVRWWKKLYLKGLGEFFYTNSITPPEDFMTLTSPAGAPASPPVQPAQTPAGVLVPIGGGKDSAVSLELLGQVSPRWGYIINPRQATLDTARAAGIPDRVIVARRTLDKRMLELNAQGCLNGHTPFSAIVAFSSVLAARLNGLGWVALSNESSANESTVAGSDVNHQYSKSYEFERDFQDYEAEYLSTGVRYFSLLRPLAELQIARLFAGYPAYHPIFRSCNAGSKTDVWCGSCPKCLFVYLILSPFLPPEELESIFHKNLLADPSLTPTFEKLVGLQPEKPFECVGSRDEVCAALAMTIGQYTRAGRPLPHLLAYYQEKRGVRPGEAERYDHYFDENNSLPPELSELLRRRLSQEARA